MRATGSFMTRPTDDPNDRDPRYPELRLGPILAFEPFSDADFGFWVTAADWARSRGVSTGPGAIALMRTPAPVQQIIAGLTSTP